MKAAVPVIFGVLTTENIEQAVERAGTKAGNKGVDAALAALEMASVYAQIEQPAGRRQAVTAMGTRRRAREFALQILYQLDSAPCRQRDSPTSRRSALFWRNFAATAEADGARRRRSRRDPAVRRAAGARRARAPRRARRADPGRLEELAARAHGARRSQPASGWRCTSSSTPTTCRPRWRSTRPSRSPSATAPTSRRRSSTASSTAAARSSARNDRARGAAVNVSFLGERSRQVGRGRGRARDAGAALLRRRAAAARRRRLVRLASLRAAVADVAVVARGAASGARSPCIRRASGCRSNGCSWSGSAPPSASTRRRRTRPAASSPTRCASSTSSRYALVPPGRSTGRLSARRALEIYLAELHKTRGDAPTWWWSSRVAGQKEAAELARSH